MHIRSKILVCDHDLASAKRAESLLSDTGYDVILSHNGEDALEKASSIKFDLILLALMLPGLNGLDVCYMIKQKYNQKIPIIFLTMLSEVRTKVAGFEWGADDFLTKPYHDEELLVRIKSHLRMKIMMDEIEALNIALEMKLEDRANLIQKLNQELHSSYQQAMGSLVNILDLREHEVSQHSLRVAFYTVELAKAWKIAGQELEEIAMGALLHDIGKIGVPDKILLKQGGLTVEEWAVMRNHVEISFSVVKDVDYMGQGRELIYSHHERFDGTGYPRRLKGQEIYIGARLFAVADTFDSMMNDRPYRKALSFEDFKVELKRCSGSQFDPRVVETFFSLPHDVWFQIAHHVDSVNFNRLISVIREE